jgi:hypothetical protein
VGGQFYGLIAIQKAKKEAISLTAREFVAFQMAEVEEDVDYFTNKIGIISPMRPMIEARKETGPLKNNRSSPLHPFLTLLGRSPFCRGKTERTVPFLSDRKNRPLSVWWRWN